MAISVFADKQVQPDIALLPEHLGDAMPLWEQLTAALAESYPGATGTWKFGSKAAGWVWVDSLKKRRLLYRMPCAGWVRVTIVLGERAAQLALDDTALPEEVKQSIRTAKAYQEGRSALIEMREAKDVQSILCLLRAKMA